MPGYPKWFCASNLTGQKSNAKKINRTSIIWLFAVICTIHSCPLPRNVCNSPFGRRDPSKLITVVGNGTSSSCNQNSLSAAFLKGGIIAFNCGRQLVIVAINIELQVSKALRGGDTTIVGSVFQDNKCSNDPVGYIIQDGSASIHNTVIANNSADSAGGLSLVNEKPVTLNRVNVLDNKAYTGLGAAAFSFCITLVTLSNSVITNNTVGNPWPANACTNMMTDGIGVIHSSANKQNQAISAQVAYSGPTIIPGL
ncbi:unnamed protein product [Rotaria magnacalcarata]|uniref:Right handed beta helix domain-containing protein n=1 Tax=Rotaria magnacalcarata TaxID=392030 RepID=A0A8S2NZN4_9BILA|nr:unnamed protein product [Rotaria magnacalcarata]